MDCALWRMWIMRWSLAWPWVIRPRAVHFRDSSKERGLLQNQNPVQCEKIKSRDICFTTYTQWLMGHGQKQTRGEHGDQIRSPSAQRLKTGFEAPLDGKYTGAYLPPNSCIPRRAKTTMKRKRRKSKLMIDFIELIKETTKFRRDAQYLQNPNIVAMNTEYKIIPKSPWASAW